MSSLMSLQYYRILVKRFFIYVQDKFVKKVNFAIFGVKNYKNTPNSIFLSSDYELSIIIDDSEEYINRSINSISIVSLKLFLKDIQKNNIKMVVMRSTDFDTQSRLNILNKLNSKGIEVVNLPHIGELKVLNAKIENLKPISINDLLGRPNVLPDKNLLKKGIDNLSVCITGAGGSIGSEICSQLIKLNPRKLILIEQNEYSLYTLLRKLDKENTNKILIKGYLGSACDFNFIFDNFKKNQIDIVFHAAAYKHVPLVEENPIYGISNNIFSTKNNL